MTSWRPVRETMGSGNGENSGKWIAEGRIYPQIIILDPCGPQVGTRIMDSLNSPESRISALHSNQRGGTLVFTGAKKKRWTAGNS